MPRLNLDVTESVREQLERCQDKSASPTITETIRRSLRLYEAVLDLEAKGGHVVFVDGDGKETRVVLL